MSSNFLLIDAKVLPDVYVKIIEAKELLQANKVKDVKEAVKIVGISRSTFYKYKDYVFAFKEGLKGQKAIISMLISQKSGTLSAVLDNIAEHNGNIYTIDQGIPINGTHTVNITLEVSALHIELRQLLELIGSLENVIKVDLIAVE